MLHFILVPQRFGNIIFSVLLLVYHNIITSVLPLPVNIPHNSLQSSEGVRTKARPRAHQSEQSMAYRHFRGELGNELNVKHFPFPKHQYNMMSNLPLLLHSEMLV